VKSGILIAFGDLTEQLSESLLPAFLSFPFIKRELQGILFSCHGGASSRESFSFFS
jgi:hypothetical protein